MVGAIESLLDILDLEPLEHNLFRGRSPQVGWQRVFGGQVIGQALVAAIRTVEDRAVHSLHGYFMRPGDPSVPIIYEVDRIRDGRSYTTRRVVGIQHGHAIFSMSASFHNAEPGFDHQSAMPDVPPPDELPNEGQLAEAFKDKMPKNMRAYWESERPIEVRPVDVTRFTKPEPMDAKQNVWLRATGKMPDDPALHQCTLAYASDLMLLDTALIAHGRILFDPSLMLASLDPALWFHRPFRTDEWFLYSQDSRPRASAAGAFAAEASSVKTATWWPRSRRKALSASAKNPEPPSVRARRFTLCPLKLQSRKSGKKLCRRRGLKRATMRRLLRKTHTRQGLTNSFSDWHAARLVLARWRRASPEQRNAPVRDTGPSGPRNERGFEHENGYGSHQTVQA